MKKIIEDVTETKEVSFEAERQELTKKSKVIFPYIILFLCAEYIVYRLLFKYLPEDILIKFGFTIKLILLLILILAIYFINKSKYQPTYNQYEVFDIKHRYSYDFKGISFCYLNSNNKLKQDNLYEVFLFNNLYIEDVNTPQIYVKEIGENTSKIIKFICNKSYYEDLKEEFSWEGKTN